METCRQKPKAHTATERKISKFPENRDEKDEERKGGEGGKREGEKSRQKSHRREARTEQRRGTTGENARKQTRRQHAQPEREAGGGTRMEAKRKPEKGGGRDRSTAPSLSPSRAGIQRRDENHTKRNMARATATGECGLGFHKPAPRGVVGSAWRCQPPARPVPAHHSPSQSKAEGLTIHMLERKTFVNVETFSNLIEYKRIIS